MKAAIRKGLLRHTYFNSPTDWRLLPEPCQTHVAQPISAKIIDRWEKCTECPRTWPKLWPFLVTFWQNLIKRYSGLRLAKTLKFERVVFEIFGSFKINASGHSATLRLLPLQLQLTAFTYQRPVTAKSSPWSRLSKFLVSSLPNSR